MSEWNDRENLYVYENNLNALQAIFTSEKEQDCVFISNEISLLKSNKIVYRIEHGKRQDIRDFGYTIGNLFVINTNTYEFFNFCVGNERWYDREVIMEELNKRVEGFEFILQSTIEQKFTERGFKVLLSLLKERFKDNDYPAFAKEYATNWLSNEENKYLTRLLVDGTPFESILSSFDTFRLHRFTVAQMIDMLNDESLMENRLNECIKVNLVDNNQFPFIKRAINGLCIIHLLKSNDINAIQEQYSEYIKLFRALKNPYHHIKKLDIVYNADTLIPILQNKLKFMYGERLKNNIKVEEIDYMKNAIAELTQKGEYIIGVEVDELSTNNIFEVFGYSHVVNVVEEKNYYSLKYVLGNEFYKYLNNPLNVLDMRHRRKTIVGRIAR